MNLSDLISRGCENIGLEVSECQLNLFSQVIEQLLKWNKAYNLTAIREPEQMVTLHLLDSLAIAPYLAPGRLLDVGTGPGFPGIPLAILAPDREYYLLDSNKKKTRFIKQLVYDFELSQVTVLDTRVEQWQPDQSFDVIVSRAFSALDKMITLTEHLLAPTGVWQAMKGEYPEKELASLPSHIEVLSVDALDVPRLEAQRHLVTLRNKRTTT